MKFALGIVVGGLIAIGFNSYFSAQAEDVEKLPIQPQLSEGWHPIRRIIDSIPQPALPENSQEPKSYSIPVNDGGNVTVWFKGSRVVRTTIQHGNKTVCEF